MPRLPVARVLGRMAAFYAVVVAASFGAVVVHEYGHYAAHEGFGVPAMHFGSSLDETRRTLLQHEPMRVEGVDYLVEQPRETLVVLYPNLVVHAVGAGLPPPQLYQDGGVLAMTYFHLEPHDVPPVAAGAGLDPMVEGVPILIAAGMLAASFAWSLLRPNRLNRALAWVYAIELGDAGHHAGAFGLDPALFHAASWLATLAAIILACMRGATFRLITGGAGHRAARPVQRTFRPTPARPAAAPPVFVVRPVRPARPSGTLPASRLVRPTPSRASPRPLVAARPARPTGPIPGRPPPGPLPIPWQVSVRAGRTERLVPG